MNTGEPNLKKLKKKIKKRLLFIIPAGFGWGIGRVQKKKENGAISNRYYLLIEKTSFLPFLF